MGPRMVAPTPYASGFSGSAGWLEPPHIPVTVARAAIVTGDGPAGNMGRWAEPAHDEARQDQHGGVAGRRGRREHRDGGSHLDGRAVRHQRPERRHLTQARPIDWDGRDQAHSVRFRQRVELRDLDGGEVGSVHAARAASAREHFLGPSSADRRGLAGEVAGDERAIVRWVQHGDARDRGLNSTR